MTEEQFYRISFLLATLGLTILFAATQISPETVEISEIKPAMAGEKVTVKGEITDPAGKQNFFFNLTKDNRSIEAVEFDSRPSYTAGEKVTVEGEIAMHQGELELIIDDIRPR